MCAFLHRSTVVTKGGVRVNLPSDIIDFVSEHYQNEQSDVLSLLEKARLHDGSLPDSRTLRCALYNASGTLDSLRYQLNGLQIDYRDVIMNAEYDQKDDELIQVRDFSKTIKVGHS